MEGQERTSEETDNVALKITIVEFMQNWIVNFFLRILNELMPLFVSIILALIVAFLSSNFDHLMKISLERIEKVGVLRYFTAVLFMCLSTLVVHILHPTVRGSGIPEMKLFLANWESPRMKDYLSCKALTTKTIGLCFAILSGFPVGKEGPFVHIACALSYFVKFKMFPVFTEFMTYNGRRTMLLTNLPFAKIIKKHYLYWKMNYLREVDIYRFLCTGCALGVACTFGAPIGGVMFSIEVTSQMFDISNYWHCFFTGMIGALFFRFFIGGLFHENWYFKPFLQSNLPGEEYEFYHFLVYIGIGVACGILGSVFILIYFVFFKAGQMYYRILNYLFRKFPTKNSFRFRIFHARTSPRRIVVTLFFTFTITLVLCIGEVIQNQDFQMPLSQHSQLTLFFSDGKKLFQDFRVISNVNMTLDHKEIDFILNFHNYFKPMLLFLAMKILFFCPIVTCLPIPRGIFFPLMIIGACLGRLLGDLTNISSAGCAIVGAAGLSGAITHSVSTAVIITEMTEEIQYLLPCAIAAFIGKLVTQIIAKYSIYNMMMRNRRMPYMPDEDEEIYSIFRKTDASSFFTSGNFISMGEKINGNKAPLVLYCDSKDDYENQENQFEYLSNESSTNGKLRSILSTIQNRNSEMQWKLIPVMQTRQSYETLIGYIRCEAAIYYLKKYFELITGKISNEDWWLKNSEDLAAILEEKSFSHTFLQLCGRRGLEYHSHDWENFLNEEIAWEEILEEKPCSVTISTRLPDIQTFVERNFLPQVFVLDGINLRGVITRENIIEQIKLLHRQSGILAVSYRADLQSLPMKIMDSDQIRNGHYFSSVKPASTNTSKCAYVKLRTHSE